MSKHSLPVAALALVFVVSDTPAAAPPAAIPRAILDRLLVECHTSGLPLPPKGSRLVRFVWAVQTVKGKDVPVHDLGFVIRNEGAEAVVWWAHDRDLRRVPRTEIQPVGRTLADRECRERNHGALFFAVACHALGWTDLAQDLLDGCANDEKEWTSKIRAATFAHWDSQIDVKGSDWRVIAGRLKRLIAVEKKLDTEEHRELVKDLESAVRRDLPAGSIGRLIDDLLLQEAPHAPRYSIARGKRTPAVQLALLGFKAVPDLIDALDDRRMTRAKTGRSTDQSPPSRRLRIQDFATDVLLDIATFDGLGNDLRRGDVLTRAEAAKWWKKVMPLREEDYAAARALKKHDLHVYVEPHPVAILLKRYPRRLIEVYRRLLKDQGAFESSWVVADAVAESPLPSEEKLELLREGAWHKDPEYRLDALRHLRRLDPATTRKALVHAFLTFPRKMKERPAFSLVSFVTVVNDDLVWKAFEQAVRRADGNVRMGMLHALARSTGVAPRWWCSRRSEGFAWLDEEAASKGLPLPQRRRVLSILALYLRDTTEGSELRHSRDLSGLRRVGDVAAVEMAPSLGVEVPPYQDRDNNALDKLRAAVREAWDRERKAAPKSAHK